jgi:hypothetical protein
MTAVFPTDDEIQLKNVVAMCYELGYELRNYPTVESALVEMRGFPVVEVRRNDQSGARRLDGYRKGTAVPADRTFSSMSEFYEFIK